MVKASNFFRIRNGLSFSGRLFQARMWRQNAMAWGNPISRPWVEQILRVSREDCLRLSRANAYLAQRLNRTRTAKLP